jgi:hypothetical protein
LQVKAIFRKFCKRFLQYFVGGAKKHSKFWTLKFPKIFLVFEHPIKLFRGKIGGMNFKTSFHRI